MVRIRCPFRYYYYELGILEDKIKLWPRLTRSLQFVLKQTHPTKTGIFYVFSIFSHRSYQEILRFEVCKQYGGMPCPMSLSVYQI